MYAFLNGRLFKQPGRHYWNGWESLTQLCMIHKQFTSNKMPHSVPKWNDGERTTWKQTKRKSNKVVPLASNKADFKGGRSKTGVERGLTWGQKVGSPGGRDGGLEPACTWKHASRWTGLTGQTGSFTASAESVGIPFSGGCRQASHSEHPKDWRRPESQHQPAGLNRRALSRTLPAAEHTLPSSVRGMFPTADHVLVAKQTLTQCK